MSSEGVERCNEPQAHPERCGCELEVPVGYVSGERFHAEHERLRECRKERNALSAELAALKAASGEEVVAWRVTGAGGLTVTPEQPRWAESDPRLCIEPLMTVAQHQRITAALRGEVEQCQRGVLNLQVQRDSARENMRYAQAELDAIRKQEPVAVGHVALGSYTGVVFYNHLPQLPDGAKLYAAPPAAAMDGGMVGLLERLQERLDPHLDARDWGLICEALRTHRQASQQEGE